MDVVNRASQTNTDHAGSVHVLTLLASQVIERTFTFKGWKHAAKKNSKRKANLLQTLCKITATDSLTNNIDGVCAHIEITSTHAHTNHE